MSIEALQILTEIERDTNLDSLRGNTLLVLRAICMAANKDLVTYETTFALAKRAAIKCPKTFRWHRKKLVEMGIVRVRRLPRTNTIGSVSDVHEIVWRPALSSSGTGSLVSSEQSGMSGQSVGRSSPITKDNTSSTKPISPNLNPESRAREFTKRPTLTGSSFADLIALLPKMSPAQIGLWASELPFDSSVVNEAVRKSVMRARIGQIPAKNLLSYVEATASQLASGNRNGRIPTFRNTSTINAALPAHLRSDAIERSFTLKAAKPSPQLRASIEGWKKGRR